MYGVAGERWLPEVVIPWLPGYAKSAPVRIGNAASNQTQFDVFGEVADVMFQSLKHGLKLPERSRTLRPVILDYLAKVWREPDEGIGKCVARPSTSCIPR
jgi:GH15 family glucan-1,4-alpha-glucosidase